MCPALSLPVWLVLSLVQRLLLEEKMATQREAYYCLVQHFRNQAEFNDTLQGQLDRSIRQYTGYMSCRYEWEHVSPQTSV